MNVGLALRKTKQRIDALDAEVIFLKAIKERDRSYLAIHDDRVLTDAEELAIEWMVSRREKGEPLAYILGQKEFYSRDFLVTKDVLIPRPESEEIINIVKNLDVQKIVDVGTGSGCLAVTLALEMPRAKITGLDISKQALLVATSNAIELGARVEFLQSDLLSAVKDEKFDVVVANLPYVDISWPWRGRELDWEPGLALYAGDHGMEIIKKMIRQAHGKTKYLVLEADPCQHEMIVQYAQKYNFCLNEVRGFVLLLENLV